ncbi:nucleolin 1 isoform X2 [Arabidopsis lyrata subsp. lyrata]|uniref:nucleolin 1 isoform X2 n=1 Tax=Arabidopsis lyrata subsp. lyrata TaxID=81972 RepID=UPI000A29C738|nr:nucleolin 1 isoform X2 [Arabidopsis lyrata subsp. lyrata]|eukprot:XP_020880784.1 nucleolin 1 isoform X2 [Arabidopsis lyrata subsp. lyrata]
MASSGEVNLLGKREPEDDLETNPILKKHKEKSEETTKGFAEIKGKVELLKTKSDQAPLKAVPSRKKTLSVSQVSCHTNISNIINFFKDVGQVVSVRLDLNREGKRLSSGFVEFASANEAKKALDKKNGEYLCGNKLTLSMAVTKAPRTKYCIDHKVWYEDYLRQESLPIEEEETSPDFVEIVPVRKKTLFVANLSPQTKMLHIINFFEDVTEVVGVRLVVNPEGKHVGYGFVEFASAYEAKEALENKNGEYLHDHKIFLDVAKTVPYTPRPKYEDYLLRESRLIEEDDTLEALDETHNFVEAVAVRKKMLCVSGFSHKTKISDIINFFKDVAKVVLVRLGVNCKGKQLGYGFVEFASANEAEKALEKNGEYLHKRDIYLDVAKADPPYSSQQPKYCIDHKVWYDDYLRRESLLIEEDEAVEGLDETSNFVEEVTLRKKTLFIANLSPQTKISHIINFFKDVAEVFSVRLIVNHMNERVGCGFVEFASANEAQKALEKKNGVRLHFLCIVLDVAEIAPYPLRPKYTLAEKLWYEDYLGRESLLIEEDDLETKPNKKMKLFGVHKKEIFRVSCGKKTTFSDDN